MRYFDGFALGMWQANCYVLGDREVGTAVVVDPGQDAVAPVTQRLAEYELRCEAILLTHGHLDHVWSVPELAARLDVPVLLHADDLWLWHDPAAAFATTPEMLRAQLGLDWDPPTERLQPVRDGVTLRLAGSRLVVRHTPGHTPGSVVYIVEPGGVGGSADRPPGRDSEPLLLSGDLVFAGSVGRTDFPRGSWDEQMASIRRVVLPLDDPTPIHSGHGPATTVGAERRTNPYLRELA